MLILDKQKAVERIVELTAHAAAEPEERTAPAKGRAYQRVARYERSASATPKLRPQASPQAPRTWPTPA
jgi:hypothetical protein